VEDQSKLGLDEDDAESQTTCHQPRHHLLQRLHETTSTFKCDFLTLCLVYTCVASTKKLVLCIIFIDVILINCNLAYAFFYININLQTVHYSVCV